MLHMKQQKADDEEIFTIAEHDFQLASVPGPLQVRNFEWEVLRLPNALLRLVIAGVTH